MIHFNLSSGDWLFKCKHIHKIYNDHIMSLHYFLSILQADRFVRYVHETNNWTESHTDLFNSQMVRIQQIPS